jgi:nucleoside-diphosphate-sugar epimerase
MPDERWLVTGALGCIGAWTCVTLAREGAGVVAFDLGDDVRRLRLIGTPQEIDAIDFVRGDITELATVERVLAEHEITHVVHLAALQVPFVRENPVLGSQVNVTGTVNVFEAARRLGLETPIAYASSAAVYDRDGTVDPSTLYGVFKLANEGTAAGYFADFGVPSVGLRPHTIYGPGRDQGLTSAPTAAMVAAARGEAFEIPFGGSLQLQYVADAGEAFVRASEVRVEGASVHNLDGPVASVEEIVAAIEAAEPGARITYGEDPLPFPPEVDSSSFTDLIGGPTARPLTEGVAESIERFREA